jgi:cardiolipin synthase A/B
MTAIQVAFPILRGRRRFHVEKGRRWSLIEHLMLDAVAQKPASALELAERSNLPRRVVVEAFIRLMRVGWAEFVPGANSLNFTATPAGLSQVGSGELKAPTTIHPRWMGFVIDQVAGSVFRRTEIAVRHANQLPKGDNDNFFYLQKTEQHSREDLTNLFTALEGDDEVIIRVDASAEKLVERFAVVTVINDVIEGLPGGARPQLRDAILSKAVEAIEKSKRKTEVSSPVIAEVKAAPAPALRDAVFEHDDVLIDGEDHKRAIEKTLRNARERVFIHSTFVSEETIPSTLRMLFDAAAKGTTVHILWGQNDDEKDKSSDSRRAAAVLKAAVDEAGRSDKVLIHPLTTRSHAKLLIADNGAGDWSAIIGSCNWLCSDFASFEMSIRLREPKLVAETIRHLAALSLGPPGIWHELTQELTILGRRIEALPRGIGRTAPMQLLLSPNHSEIVLEARDKATRRIFATSHRLGLAGRPMVIVPAVAAAKAKKVKVDLYYGRTTGVLSGVAAADLIRELSRQGLSIRPVHEPRLHAKILAWDDDDLAVTSQNWLSADPGEGATRREMGVHVKSGKIADFVIRRFEHARAR